MYEYEDLEYLENKLKTSLSKGLNDNEVIRRQRYSGKNILEEKNKDNGIRIFINQLRDPMIYILLISIVISIFLKEISDAIVIAIVVIVNALIGTFQQIKTEKALEVLKKSSALFLVKAFMAHLNMNREYIVYNVYPLQKHKDAFTPLLHL